MAALALSCTREAEQQNAPSVGGKMEICAAWAEGEASRTVLAENGTDILWAKGEEINLFYGSRFSGKFTSTNTEPQAIVSFVGDLTSVTGYGEQEIESSAYWAVYPYGAENFCDGKSVTLTLSLKQSGKAGSFADKSFPAVASGATSDLAFYNVCGGARFSVVTGGVKKVVFRSNDGSPMAGTVRVDFGSDGKPQILEISDAKDSVVVNAPESGFVPGTNYFAAMLPQTHEQGLTVTLYTASKKAVKTIDKSITVRRSAFGTLDNMDEGLDWQGSGSAVPEMVDLGLSVKWASFNVGASAPEEYGDYFAWGEVEPKDEYSLSTYKWYMNGDAKQLTKYCNDPSYGYNGFTDRKTILDPEDDAATVNWGDKWRMPTLGECQELIDNCTWEWTTLNGVYGRKFTSNKSGYTDKWIFLPAAGFQNVSSLDYASEEGFYWSSSLYNLRASAAYLRVNSGSVNWIITSTGRCKGLSVRPVYGKLIRVTGISVSPRSTRINLGESVQLTATITPANASDKSVTWSSSNTSVAKVSSDGLVTAVGAGTANISVNANDGGFTASCTVSVIFEQIVDLGLSVKWASFNVGASYPWEYGDYFAWGETEPKEDYRWSTYEWCVGVNKDQLTKYCNDSSYGYNGFTDGKTILDADDDAATVNWGGRWRMPTIGEYQELIDNCTWEWTTLNGVSGRKITSTKRGYTDKWIFLPAAGTWINESVSYAGSYGYYWSSSLYTDMPSQACYVYLFSDGEGWRDYGRAAGRSVRPVCN